MSDPNAKLTGPLYSCRSCTKWVPAYEAVKAHNQGYALHFCGTTCYEKWSAKQKEQDPKTN